MAISSEPSNMMSDEAAVELLLEGLRDMAGSGVPRAAIAELAALIGNVGFDVPPAVMDQVVKLSTGDRQ